MNVVEQGLYNKLIADTSLTSELVDGSAVYNQVAPQGTARPYIVFFNAGGGPANDTPSDTRAYVYAVKGVADASKKAGTIAGKIETALHRQTLTVTGYTNYQTMATDTISNVEALSDGALVFHRGAYYRIGIDNS